MDAMVFVVDNINKDYKDDPYDDHKDEAKSYIEGIIKYRNKEIPILVIANDQEDLDAKSKEAITEELGLTKITDREWSKFYDLIHLVFTPLSLDIRKTY